MPKPTREQKKAEENARQARALSEDIFLRQSERDSSRRRGAASQQSSSDPSSQPSSQQLSSSSSQSSSTRGRKGRQTVPTKAAMKSKPAHVAELPDQEEAQEEVMEDTQEDEVQDRDTDTTSDPPSSKGRGKKSSAKKTPSKKTPSKKTPAKKTSSRSTSKSPSKSTEFSPEMEDKLATFFRENECFYNKADPNYMNTTYKLALKAEFALEHRNEHPGLSGIMFLYFFVFHIFYIFLSYLYRKIVNVKV